MTEPIEDALDEIVTVVRAISGINQVPINPPETINVATFGLVYAESGVVGINALGQTALGSVGARAGFHNIIIDILTKRTDLARNILFVKPFIDTVTSALLYEITPAGTQFNGKVTTFGLIRYEWINVVYAKVVYTGYRFTMENVKILINT